MKPMTTTRDVVGVGFGPGNLGLAIAMSEYDDADQNSPPLDAVFLERRHTFGWHPGMLLPGTNMQISFLKDLVTQRNPRSRFTFVNYLVEKDRLTGFINRQTFTPERVEFADYLSWVADHVAADVRYSRNVIGIEQVDPHDADAPAGARFRVVTTLDDGSVETYFSRTVVVALGLRERLPKWADRPELTESGRVFHNHRFLDHLDALRADIAGSEFLVVGGGQSAAEAIDYLYTRGAGVTSTFHGYGFAPADDSPFANQVFDPSAVDDFYAASEDVRADLLNRHRYTNYSCVEPQLLTTLHDHHYRESVTGQNRLHLRRSTAVTSASVTDQGRVQVELYDRIHRTHDTVTVDAVVCATGFTSPGVDGISAIGDTCVVGRDHQAVVDGTRIAGLFVQGATQGTHGLGATLLSNIAIRAGELRSAIISELAQPEPAEAELAASGRSGPHRSHSGM